ncbi:E3 ubiquitin-protein ligase [Armadillidium vulgare]|nr:E3 ubiquitin-protein ligase [Armadillidium vulgare]
MDLELLENVPGIHLNQGNLENSSGSGSTASGSSSGPRRRHILNPRHGRRSIPYRLGHDHRQQALAPILQEVIMQITSSILGPGVGVEPGIFADGVDLPAFPMLLTPGLASNPGDYAWGRGGLDAIITQLMNQLDGTGPPPLPQEKINQIPTVKITQEQCDKSLQCTVCMEDFNLDELVRKLNCEHCYHEDCIIPWLQLHGTCPVCRKTLMSETSNNSTEGSGGGSGGIHFHFGRGGDASIVFSSSTTTSTPTTAERNTSSSNQTTNNSSGNNNNSISPSSSVNSSRSPRLEFIEDDLD